MRFIRYACAISGDQFTADINLGIFCISIQKLQYLSELLNVNW